VYGNVSIRVITLSCENSLPILLYLKHYSNCRLGRCNLYQKIQRNVAIFTSYRY